MTVGVVLLAVLVPGMTVIAAQEQIDQPGDVSSSVEVNPNEEPDRSIQGVRPSPIGTMIWVAAAVLAGTILLRRRWHKFSRRSERDVSGPITILLGLGMFMFMWMLGIGGAAVFGKFQSPPPADAPVEQQLAWQTSARLIVYAMQLIVVVWYARLWMKWPRSDRDRRRPGSAHAAIIGIAGLALWYPMMFIANFIAAWGQELISGSPTEVLAHSTLRQLAEVDAGLWRTLTILTAIIAAPIFEEVMYRGLLQRTFAAAGQGPWARIALTSIVFALFHIQAVQPHALVGLFVLSLGFGWVFERTGRLAAPIAMHMAFNALNVILLFSIPPS